MISPWILHFRDNVITAGKLKSTILLSVMVGTLLDYMYISASHLVKFFLNGSYCLVKPLIFLLVYFLTKEILLRNDMNIILLITYSVLNVTFECEVWFLAWWSWKVNIVSSQLNIFQLQCSMIIIFYVLLIVDLQVSCFVLC